MPQFRTVSTTRWQILIYNRLPEARRRTGSNPYMMRQRLQQSTSMQSRATLGHVKFVVGSSILSGFPMAVAIEKMVALLIMLK